MYLTIIFGLNYRSHEAMRQCFNGPTIPRLKAHRGEKQDPAIRQRQQNDINDSGFIVEVILNVFIAFANQALNSTLHQLQTLPSYIILQPWVPIQMQTYIPSPPDLQSLLSTLIKKKNR